MNIGIPKDCWLWQGEDCIADAGSIIPGVEMDVTTVQVALDLRGNFIGKILTLRLIDDNDPSRVFESTKKMDVSGFLVGFSSFEFEKFHTKDTDSYQIQLCINDDTDLTFALIADWEPYVSQHSNDQTIPGPRLQMYGVTSGLHAC